MTLFLSLEGRKEDGRAIGHDVHFQSLLLRVAKEPKFSKMCLESNLSSTVETALKQKLSS